MPLTIPRSMRESDIAGSAHKSHCHCWICPQEHPQPREPLPPLDPPARALAATRSAHDGTRRHRRESPCRHWIGLREHPPLDPPARALATAGCARKSTHRWIRLLEPLLLPDLLVRAPNTTGARSACCCHLRIHAVVDAGR
uniref:Uncharacterized protein n=1 Tax=Oryza glumipatula TaxID=40148 RepID=A0A0D9ZZ61_9ORYZ